MSEAEATPLITFSTRTNSELGAEGLSITADGSVVLEGVLKKVTESMLTSYPRDMLGTWTPNRAAIAYPRDEIAQRRVTKFDSGEELDLEAILALAS
jgi:hypothetical protein